MTARTSKLLADVLKKAGFIGLAMRAEQDEFHDYLSPHGMPGMVLDEELRAIIADDRNSERARMAAHNIRERFHDGEFDADDIESDEWAASPEGQATFKELYKGKKP